ncbi:trehalose-phosphatase [Dactylosporangium sp. NPDC048998]|uniref:trehalose-phosphatase n=1 Tax=Dactylosporangium sp. NPDC048998 TaxID=3363976 RepID=UPI00371F63F4
MTAGVLVAADLDGTLVPASPHLPGWRDERDELPGFCARLTGTAGVTFACVTGRRALSARRVLGAATIVVGLHGAEVLRPEDDEPVRHPVPPAVAAGLRTLAAHAEALVARLNERPDGPGLTVEDKGLILTVHHVAVPAASAARMLAPLAGRAAAAGLVVVPGRGWTEVRPPGLPDKGDAVLDLVRRHRPAVLAVAGDDRGDAAMFRAAGRAMAEGMVSRVHRIHVRGPGAEQSNEDLADVVLDSPRECREQIVALVAHRKDPIQR